MPFEDAPPPAITVALSPDGRSLAVATGKDDDQPLRLYDLPSGTLSRSQPGGIPANSGLNELYLYDVDPAFSRDGSRLVAELQHFTPLPRSSAFGDAPWSGTWPIPPSRCSRFGFRRSPSPR